VSEAGGWEAGSPASGPEGSTPDPSEIVRVGVPAELSDVVPEPVAPDPEVPEPVAPPLPPTGAVMVALLMSGMWAEGGGVRSGGPDAGRAAAASWTGTATTVATPAVRTDDTVEPPGPIGPDGARAGPATRTPRPANTDEPAEPEATPAT